MLTGLDEVEVVAVTPVPTVQLLNVYPLIAGAETLLVVISPTLAVVAVLMVVLPHL